MKTVSTAVLDLLQTGEYVAADLYTITLNGGSVVRWTSHDQSVSWAGQVFTKMPLSRGTIGEKTGTDVSTLQVTLYGNSTDLINGVPVIPFIAQHGFDGASLKLERVYGDSWASTSTLAGTIIRFAGKITSIDSIQGGAATFTVSSWMVLLNTNMPRNVYQAACQHSLYDAGCTLNPASFSASGHTTSAGGTVTFPTNLTPTANDYALGRIVFTSGPNNGLTRAVKSNDGSGNFTLMLALPNPVGSADNFTVYKGCDLTMATCSGKFSNLVNFKAEPFTPPPRTVIATPSTTTTTSGGKG
jgi:uncharacterized phage protein (TIGR02218 family)